MSKFQEFEASLFGMLVTKCNADCQCLAQLVSLKDLHGRRLVERVLEMKLVDEGRLSRLISQYWELPWVDVAFPYRHFLVHFNRPVLDLLAHDLLPLEFHADEVTAVGYYVPSDHVVREIEDARGVRLKIYIAEMTPVKEALLRLGEEVKRFEKSEPVECAEDKELFFKVTDEGWPARVRERIAGGTVLIEFHRDRTLIKTVESLDPTEPDVVRQLLLGKSMTAAVPPGSDLRKYAGDFVDTVGYFDGELTDGILKLSVARMMFDTGDKA